MAAANAQSISALLQKSSLDDHEEILKACNAALKKSKTDIAAQHVKAVALLKLDRYEEALHVFESAGKNLKETAPLEYAYSLYKDGKSKEAADVAARLKDGRAARHVEAQALYRAEDFQATANVYRDLQSSDPTTEQSDLRINRGAVEAQLIWSGKRILAERRKPGREDLEAFETAYNAACGSIARGELRQAEVLLKRAKELCKYSDDLSDEEKAAELLPICVQQLYVLERLGKSEEAKVVASEFKAADVADKATKQIAQHNLLVGSEEPSNPYLAHKMLDNGARFSDDDKPFRFQQRVLNANLKTVDLHALKFDGVARSTSKVLKSQQLPSTSAELTSLGVLNAAAHARGEDGKSALKHLLPELERSPYNIGLLLTIIQVYVSIHNPTSAINHLESFFTHLERSPLETKQEIRFSPGLVTIAVALYKSQGRHSHASRELAQAASYWRRTSDPPQLLLRAAGATLLESLDPEDTSLAAESFTILHEKNRQDMLAAAGYVAAYASKDSSKVKNEVAQLTPVLQLIQGIDVDSLENAGIPQPSNALAIAQKTASRKRGAPDQALNRPKRIRKSRLPKDHDSAKVPDPERWLQLRDRSTYRAKGKKGRKKDADRTQGGIVADDVGMKDAGPPTRPPGVGSGGNKKNKKKGKK
ncbi:hypothetical protein GJ744_005690 [Endocarpon pusillum]|uniref:Signal recognition particle subunit SRP72 n=1 Tax=Endocarpon pusillum TaxID=364733 RepID=A0A8H7ATI3_9EURO|nr:hypothetical protein GJ744_005690 [Endocarpon pusillum]